MTKVYNLYPSLHTKRVYAISETQNVHEKKVEGELHAGPHLTLMQGPCNMECNFKHEKEEIDDRRAHSSVSI